LIAAFLAGDHQLYERQLQAVVPIGNLPSKRRNTTCIRATSKANEVKRILLQKKEKKEVSMEGRAQYTSNSM
jgi:hypothetical protein